MPASVENPSMFSSSQLTSDQKEALIRWAAEGATMADLQRRMKEELGLSVTYMDTRFVVLDLGLELKQEEKAVEKKPEIPAAVPVPTGKVTATIDDLVLPGAIVSGRVTFSDGEAGTWLIDQSGRPALDPDRVDYRPKPEDIAEFQTQLRALLQTRGY